MVFIQFATKSLGVTNVQYKQIKFWSWQAQILIYPLNFWQIIKFISKANYYVSCIKFRSLSSNCFWSLKLKQILIIKISVLMQNSTLITSLINQIQSVKKNLNQSLKREGLKNIIEKVFSFNLTYKYGKRIL